MIESITWYLKNTKETLPKFQEYIYIIGNYEHILYILSLILNIIMLVEMLYLIIVDEMHVLVTRNK